jgi:hypothetical protein
MARVLRTIELIVAGFAEATERSQAERGEVALVWLDVVGDRRWHDMAALKTQPTQRLDGELMAAAAQPVGGAIPAMDSSIGLEPIKIAHAARLLRRTLFSVLLIVSQISVPRGSS